MKFKLKDTAMVTLTKKGARKLKTVDEKTYKSDFDKTTRVLETPLWNLFNIFGDSFFAGTERSPFFENEIHQL